MKKLILLLFFITCQMSFAQWTQGGTIRTSACETLSNIHCFVADSVNLYIGANDVKCSSNNGTNWIDAGIGFVDASVHDLKYHDKMIYAATSGGVWQTPDFTAGWNKLKYGLASQYASAIIFSNNTLYTATVDKGLFKSTNLGGNWLPASPNSILPYSYCLAFFKNYLLAGTSNGVWKSSDDGYSWIISDNGLPSKIVNNLLVIGQSIFAGLYEGGIYKSTDEGATWKQIKSLKTTKNDVFNLLAYGNVIFAGTDDGIYMSKDDGVSWSCINNNIPLKGLYELAFIVKDKQLIAGITPGDDGELTIIRAPISSFGLNLDLTITGSTISCLDLQSVFSTKSENGVTISWSVTNGEIIGSNSQSNVQVKWNNTGEGKITLTKENKSLNKKESSFMLIQVVKSDKPIITRNGDTLFSSSPTGNQWYFNGKPINGSILNTYVPKSNGNYSVDVYFNDCKSVMSDSVNFKITDVEDILSTKLLEIFPNPANDIINVSYGDKAYLGKIEILSLLGERILVNTDGNNSSIDISSLPMGMYFIKVGSQTRKFIKFK